jgi:hypothetical protein
MIVPVQGIDTWLLTGDTNDPASTDPIVQLGWFQVLKDYIPHKWNLLQVGFFRSQGKRSQYKTGEQWTNQLITFLWMHSHTLWKDRLQLATTAQTTSALALDRQHNNEWKHNTHTVLSC